MSSACSSSISLQKSMSQSSGRKSCETICSSNSSCYLQKRKPVNPLATSVRNNGSRADNAVRQRVMSAKLIKLRNLQSQLNDANYHLMELAKENRALKTLQKRQDKALNNYEGINADLPRLIKSYEEENRALTEKNRTLKRSLKDVTEQVKIKDEELMVANDQLKHLSTLSKDKRLMEREKLQELLEESRMLVKKYETEIAMLNRKLILEMKNNKQKLNNEITKHKRCQRELAQAVAELDRLSEGKEKFIKRRFEKSPTQQQSLSMVCLTHHEIESSTSYDQTSDTSSELKLEPITKRVDSAESQTTMQSPIEKIKARLSAGQEKHISISQISDIMEKLTAEEENIKKSLNGTRRVSVEEKRNKPVRIPSGRLEKINHEEVHTPTESFEKCRLKLEETAENASFNVDKLLEKFEAAKVEDDELLKSSRVGEETADEQEQDLNTVELEMEDLNLVDQIWSEEFTFRKNNRDSNGNVTNKRDPVVALEKKKKLLATLRDIDNGKVVEEGGDNNKVDCKKNRLMRELFG